MNKEMFKKDVINKALAYGEKCAIARSRDEKFPRPGRTIDLILYKYQIVPVGAAKKELVKELSNFGSSIYYYRGEFAGNPSRRFMVELLQRTRFFQTLNLLEAQIPESRLYPADSIWTDATARRFA